MSVCCHPEVYRHNAEMSSGRMAEKLEPLRESLTAKRLAGMGNPREHPKWPARTLSMMIGGQARIGRQKEIDASIAARADQYLRQAL